MSLTSLSTYSDEIGSPIRHNLAYSSLPASRSESPVPASVNPVIPKEERPYTPLSQAAGSQDPRYLLNAVKNLMRTRHGSVLTRNTILKMDHFEKGKMEIFVMSRYHPI